MTLFGGIYRTTKVAFAVSAHKRDAATLKPFLQRNIESFYECGENRSFYTFLLDQKIQTSILRKLAHMARIELQFFKIGNFDKTFIEVLYYNQIGNVTFSQIPLLN